MSRTTVTALNPKSKRNSIYEGVLLEDLVPGGLDRYTFDVFTPRWIGFTDKFALSSRSLTRDATIIVVADTIDGKKLKTENPYIFIAKMGNGVPLIVNSVAFLRLNSAWAGTLWLCRATTLLLCAYALIHQNLSGARCTGNRTQQSTH